MAQHVDADASRAFDFSLPYWRGVWPLAAAWWLAAFGDATWCVAQGTALYGIVPTTKNRPAFFASFNMMSFLSYSVLPLISFAVLQSLGDISIKFMGMTFDHFQLFFVICAGIMAVSGLTVLWIPNSRSEVLGPEPVCHACGYPLKMIEATQCPECGATVAPAHADVTASAT
jgi:hypothetical protein